MSRSKFKEYDVNRAFFPVELRPLYMRSNGKDESLAELPRHLAVVDIDNEYTFSVVTDGYHLVCNEEAVEKSKELFCRVFNNISYEDMQCLNVTMPKTRSYCHIDYIHKNSDFNVWEEDTWTPFVRVTNSYNRTKLLRYEIGFCRWICMNGMIFGAKSVEFSYSHSRSQKENINKFVENIGDIKKLEAELTEILHQLKRYYVPSNLMFPLVLKVFSINFDERDFTKAKKIENIKAIEKCVKELTSKYFDDLGHHGYSALNVLTDFASRPIGVISPTSVINTYQEKCGNWISDFINQIDNKSFSFDEYLKTPLKTVDYLNQIA